MRVACFGCFFLTVSSWAQVVVLKADRLFAGQSNAVVSPGVVINGTRIESVNPAGQLPAVPMAQVTLRTGFTTIRDLGGAQMMNIGLREGMENPAVANGADGMRAAA
jgi:hypothetical protein